MFNETGYLKIENFLSEKQIEILEAVLIRFHESWLERNRELYEERAINSAYLTHSDYCSVEDRQKLFQFISSEKVYAYVCRFINSSQAKFLNTQLFFDPYQSSQKNYWHRDIQYSNLAQASQREAIENKPSNVLHFRFAMRDENGIEVVPGTHKRWDTEEELKVRLENEGKHSFEELPNTKVIELKRGDLLIFSANMIHRGLYGKDRLSFDILYCENDPEVLQYAEPKCFPDKRELAGLNNTELFDLDFFT